MNKIKVLVVPSNRDWSGQHRSINPHLNLETQYPDKFFVDIDFEPDLDNEDYLKQYDIVHYHNKLGSFSQTAHYVEKLSDLGIIPVLDIDEYWLPHPKHPAHKLIKSREIDKAIIESIKSAKYITTTTETLADHIKKYNKEVKVLATGVDLNDKYMKSSAEKSQRIRIGWVGTPNSMADLEPLRGFVSKLRSDNLLDKVQFVLGGFDLSDRRAFFNHETGEMDSRPLLPLETVWYQYEKIFTENYTTLSPEYKRHLITFEEKEFSGDVNKEPYRRLWTSSNPMSHYKHMDVVLMPFLDNTYNNCIDTHMVKALGLLKKPLIVQSIEPYKKMIVQTYEKGGTLNPYGSGFLISPNNNHKEWYKCIKKILLNPGIVESMGQNSSQYTSINILMDKTTETRKNFYWELLVANKCNSFVGLKEWLVTPRI